MEIEYARSLEELTIVKKGGRSSGIRACHTVEFTWKTLAHHALLSISSYDDVHSHQVYVDGFYFAGWGVDLQVICTVQFQVIEFNFRRKVTAFLEPVITRQPFCHPLEGFSAFEPSRREADLHDDQQ